MFWVQFSCSIVSNSLQSHEPHHARPPCPSPTGRVYSNPCPLSQWCPPPISSSVIPFSSCLQSFPALGSFLMSQFFALGRQSVGVSASASVHGILQARMLEWGAIPFSRGPNQPRDQNQVSHIAGRFFTTEPPGKPSIWPLFHATCSGLCFNKKIF